MYIHSGTTRPDNNDSDQFSLAPLSVCWDITSRCNDKCAFCYRVLSETDLSLEKHQLILKKLINAGVRKVSFAGGDPLLVKHLPALLDDAHKERVTTSIITNGILLKQKWDNIAQNVDWVTLPIDGSNEQIQSKMTRRKGHLDLIYSLIEMLRRYGTSIKINTVVGHHNILDLPNIAQLISKLGVQRWKIFQFVPNQGYAFRNAEQFRITDSEFHRSVNNVLHHNTELTKCNITIADKDYREGNYFSISPEGNARVTVNERYEIVGSLLYQDVAEIWQSPLFNHVKHAKFRHWLNNQ